MKIPKDESRHRESVHKFEAGDESGPIEDLNQYEQRLDALPSDEKEVAQQSVRFADTCRYFADKKMDVPSHVLDLFEGLSRAPLADRVRILKDANQRLTEYLNDVSEDPHTRQ